MIDGVSVDSSQATFMDVAREIFNDGQFNWGRVVMLFYFAYKMAKKVNSYLWLLTFCKVGCFWVKENSSDQVIFSWKTFWDIGKRMALGVRIYSPGIDATWELFSLVNLFCERTTVLVFAVLERGQLAYILHQG